MATQDGPKDRHGYLSKIAVLFGRAKVMQYKNVHPQYQDKVQFCTVPLEGRIRSTLRDD